LTQRENVNWTEVDSVSIINALAAKQGEK